MANPNRAVAPILFVHYGDEWIRGSERCLLDLVEHLDRTRYRPIVWCNAATLADAARAVGAEVHHAPTAARDARYPLSRAMVRVALALVRRHGIRLIHANDTSPLPALVFAARRRRIPLLTHVHLIQSVADRRWALLHQVDLAVGVSRASVEGLLADGMPSDRVTVIYNGIDSYRLGQGSAAGLRAQLGIPADSLVASVVASLITRKGIGTVIQALATLRSQRRDVHLIVCGDGPEEDALRAAAQELGVASAVHFLGARSDVGAVLRDASDVLVSAARLEAFPLNLLEAGMCGLPVVVSDIAPHYEAVRDGKTGFIVPTDDSAAFARAVARLADDPARRRAMGEAARAHVRAHFDFKRWLGRFDETYTALLARSPRELGWVRGSTWPPVYTAWVRESIRRRLAGHSADRIAAPAPV